MAYVPIVRAQSIPVPDDAVTLDIPLQLPPRRELNVTLLDASGAPVDRPVRLLVAMPNVEEHAFVVTDGRWSEARAWNGSFHVSATALDSGAEGSARFFNDGTKPLPEPLAITLAAPWRIRIRPTGVPAPEEFDPLIANLVTQGSSSSGAAAVLEFGEWVDVLVPGEGPWDIDLRRGENKASLRDVRATQQADPAPHDVSFAQLAVLEVDFTEAMDGHRMQILSNRQLLTVVPLREGKPQDALHLRGASVGASVFRWMLPPGRHYLSLGGGRREAGWLWATTEPVLLDPSRAVRVMLAPRPVRVVELLLPGGTARPDWETFHIVPQGELSWLGGDKRMEIYATPDSARALLWPGRFALIDGDGAVRFEVEMTEGVERVALTLPGD
jgi:hypothetical protein